MTIHARIKARRTDLGMTMEELAAKVGVTWQTIQQWEKSTAPSRRRLPIAAASLECDEAWLATGKDSNANTDQLQSLLSDWRLRASPKSVTAIDTLTVLAQKNELRDEDWQLIEELAHRLRAR
jgi:transcriptional regulator with XRE-family HTH domain